SLSTPTTASCSASTRLAPSRRSPAGPWRPCAGSSSDPAVAAARDREGHGTGGGMRLRTQEPIQVKTPAQLSIMREAGLVTAAALHAAAAAVEPGISTAELDAIAEREIRPAGALPSFRGYHGYPATICTSVNDQIVHGIPDPARVLSAGDIISIDCG